MQALHGIGFILLASLGLQETRRYVNDGPSVFGYHLLNYHYINVAFLVAVVLVLGVALKETAQASEQARKAAKKAAKKANKKSTQPLSGHSDVSP